MSTASSFRLIAEALACERGGRTVFTDVNFSAGAGELVAVTGRNGAGKSSLLRVIAQLVPCSQGRVWIEGSETERTLSEQIHYCGHADALKASLSVGENLQFWQDYYGSAGDTTEEALSRFDMEHLNDLPASYLSAGQKRRLSLCRLFVSRRPVWLLDEPTAALDTGTQQRLAGIMREHLDRGGLIMAATHSDLGIKPHLSLSIGPP